MNPFAIRRPQPADAARLTALMRETFITANGHCSSPRNVEAFLDTTCTVDRQRAELADDGVTTLVAQARNGDWAGYAQLRMATAPKTGVTLAHPFELGRIYLLPRFHRFGLGRALLQRLAALATRRGADGLWLNAWQQAPAIGFYLHHGFEIVGSTVFTVGDDPKPNWVMQKRLARVPA